MRDGSTGQYPMLSKTNYYSWATLMKLKLQARSLSTVVNVGTNDFVDDRNALETIALGVPLELQGSIANKLTAKIAWDSLKKMHLGVDRVRQARANTMRHEFDTLKFKDGETVDDFGVCICDLANQPEVLDAGYMEPEIVRKFLQATPSRYSQIVMAIETILNLDELSVEELIGRLKAAEEWHRLGGGGGGSMASLNLSEDELVARIASCLQLFGGGSSGGTGSSSMNQRRGHSGGRGRDGGTGGGSKAPTGGNGKKKKKLASDECAYCGKMGHWAHECRKKKRDEAAHVAQVEEPKEGMLLLGVTSLSVTSSPTSQPAVAPAAPSSEDGLFVKIEGRGSTRWTFVEAEPKPMAHVALATAVVADASSSLTQERREVHLEESKLFILLSEKSGDERTRWILDIGTTNHMTGERSIFSNIDAGVHGTIRFGDGSVVNIKGRGTILFSCKISEH